MKKLLTIVIGFLLGIGYAFSANGTYGHTVNVYAYKDGDCTNYAGGTVAVQGCTRGDYNKTNCHLSTITNYGTTANATAWDYKYNFLGEQYAPARAKIYASPNTGYYFAGWYTKCSGGTCVSTDTPYGGSDGFVLFESNPGAAKELHYYAIFNKYAVYTNYATVGAVYLDEEGTYTVLNQDNYTNIGSVDVSLDASANPTFSYASSYGDDSSIKSVSEDQKTTGTPIAGKFTYTYFAKATDAYYFIGWATKNVDDGYTMIPDAVTEEYTHTHETTTNVDDDAPKPATLYAVFKKKPAYIDRAVTKAILVDTDLRYLSGKEEGDAMAGGVYVNSDANATPDYGPMKTFGTEETKVVDTEASNAPYYYTYFAKANENYQFLGWTVSEPQEGMAVELLKDAQGNTINSSQYTHAHTASAAKMEAPAVVYAVFRLNAYYYHYGAQAGFATNGEKGRITVTSTATYMKEGENTYSRTTTNEDIKDMSVYKIADVNENKFSFTYTAEDIDDPANDKSVFKGWSRDQHGKTIDYPESSFSKEYTSYAASAERTPEIPDMWYAVFRSYWYYDPTVQLTTSSAGTGQVAYVYSTDKEQTPTEYKEAYGMQDAELHQVPAHDDSYDFSVCYWAKPNFGTQFVGWADSDNPDRLITNDTENPYLVQYSASSITEEDAYVPPRLYAVFKSVIEIIHKDRMIYYVDENGNENINDANLIINFNKTNILHAELIEGDLNANLFELSDKQGVSKGKSIDLDATQGIIQLVLSYKGNTPKAHVGREAIIRLSANYDNNVAQIDVPIIIEEQPNVTFLHTDGKGDYTIKHTDGRGVKYTMLSTSNKHIYVPILQENMATFELEFTRDANANDGLVFSGWEMITKDGARIFSSNEKCTYTFTQSASVRPVFKADNMATFSILTCDGNYYKNENIIHYTNLQEALDVAEERYKDGLGEQVVVFSNNDNVIGTLQSGDYVINTGVTLLIPGIGPTPVKVGGKDDTFLMTRGDDQFEYESGKFKNKYIYREKHKATVNNYEMDVVLQANVDYIYKSLTPVCYRKLIVEDNTTITVMAGGNINIYAHIATNANNSEALPVRYGQIELGENCEIKLETAATEGSTTSLPSRLYAFGFITGSSSSSVVAKSGSEVFELLQYSEYRGGAGIAHLYLLKDTYKTFPISQYYCQNIEVPLTLKYGAVENVTTSAYVLSTQYVLMSGFIVPNTAEYTSGFVRMDENTEFFKSYDAKTDRLNMALIGTGAGASAEIGSLNIQLGSMKETINDLMRTYIKNIINRDVVADLAIALAAEKLEPFSNVSLVSSEYRMPITSNIDFTLQNVALTTPYDLCFLAGSTLTIDDNAEFIINNGAKVFVYDADENLLPVSERAAKNDVYRSGEGYFSSQNYALSPIVYTPNSTHLIAPKSLKREASKVKDATWIVNGAVTIVNGGFYTTAGGARIISHTTGQVNFVNAVGASSTNQAKYQGGGIGELIDISVGFSGVNIEYKENGVHKRIEYPVKSAYLQHANGSYETSATKQGTYTYNPAKGKWELTESVTDELNGDAIQVTLPDYNLSTPEIDPLQTTVVSNLTVSSAEVSWGGEYSKAEVEYKNQKYYIQLNYIPKNVEGEYEGLVRINNNTYQRIVVVEDYTPDFTLPEECRLTAYLGSSAKQNINIQPIEQNVASIMTGAFKEKVVWEYNILGENADEFAFEWGDTDATKLSGATVHFIPKTANDKYAVLAITCSYTDGATPTANTRSTTVTIPLKGTVNALTANPLAFADGVNSMFVSADATPLFANVVNANTNPIKITIDGSATSEYVTIVNDGMASTIKPNKIGAISVTASQAADIEHGIAASSITKTITITDNIVWNWDRLYFGSKNKFPISTLYKDWRLEVKDNHLNVIREFNSIDPGDGYYEVILESWPDGEANPTFTLTYDDGNGETTKDFDSHVTRDPRQLSVYVTEDEVYEAITLNVSNVEAIASTQDYNVKFNSTDNQIAQWTFYFIGIPDKLTFNASGNNNWQIEESTNGMNWTIAYTWAPISSSTEFELSLQPSTNYVRISYGTSATSSMGVLSKIAVTELLSVKADVEKLYMPIIEPSSQKNVVFTYVSESDLALKTNSDVFTTNPTSLTGSNQSPFYQIKRVAVKADNSTATTEIKDGMLSVSGSSAAVPIRTYTYPQELPIQLASDELERYYFVTSESYNTSWSNDEATRSIIMRNAVADASPYVVFHFDDAPAPGVISFNYANISDGASWTVQESEDGTVWYDLEVDTENEKAGLVMRKFSPTRTALYARVIYNSDYAGIVEITNMAILPTTSVVVNPAQLTVFSDQPEELSVIASNLQDVQFTFTPSEAFSITKVTDKEGVVQDNGIQYFRGAGAHNGKVLISYDGDAAVTYGKLEITTDDETKVLATVDLTGVNRYLPAGVTGIKTGTGLQIINFNYKNEGDEGCLRSVNTEHAFEITRNSEGEITTTPLFDYVIIYGETKTTDGSGTITAPSSVTGSNAQTPCYIYQKTKVGNTYKYQITEDGLVENANSSRKSWRGAISIADTDPTLGEADPTPENLRVYITGFCPYASTGYTQSDEGVWYFEGDAGDKIDIYLEDCYIYSRYKSKRGNSFTRESGESYSGMVARGSGAVLLFANKIQKDGLTTPLEVTIHTRDRNLLKSHYGCLFSSFVGRAFQISAPIHIYMQSENHYRNSHTELNFTDEWPTAAAVDSEGQFTTTERTNGFLSLRKQVNNAPSIDMGNANTVVNFRGGQVELENARISSDNYESTLAISYRTGVYGPAKFRFVLSYGIGTDGVDGRVNFYDGTTTVRPMEVETRFQQYYLMDDNGKTTSCLRLPKNTFVYGGSHCMMRACEAPTSKGGAPTDGDVELREEYDKEKEQVVLKPYITGNPLGLYQTDGWDPNGKYGLVKPTNFPGSLKKSDATTLKSIHDDYPEECYGVSSITPNKDGVLNLWIPAGFGVGKQPEVEQKISFWKASMTKIAANYGVYNGEVGGDFSVEMNAEGNQVEQVQNLLYCQIDEKIIGVIRKNTGDDKYVAPVLNPAPDGGYISIAPTSVGEDVQHYIGNKEPYRVEDKVYYVTTIPQADVWINFTAPFNVEKIYVVETYDENVLSALGNRESVMEVQAKHNADFAAFFGVAIALESKKTFDLIYKDYLGWVKEQDKGTTDKRGMLELEQYYETYVEGEYVGSNWKTADYYLYKNTGDWELTSTDADGNPCFTTKWEFVAQPAEGQALLKQGETYSMLFPYCTGCDVTKDAEGNVETDENGDPIIKTRDYWDYWSGKFLIFESTDGPHIIQGSDYLGTGDPNEKTQGDWAFEVDESQIGIKLMGNSTFASFTTNNSKISVYTADPMQETYAPLKRETSIQPTSSFLYGDTGKDGIRPRIMRDGSIRYDNQNGTSGMGHMPTVGGGKDMFITAIEGGINIAVAEPQMVKVMSSTGAVLFAGYITTATDVQLPTHGIYIVSGENEVQKVLY